MAEQTDERLEAVTDIETMTSATCSELSQSFSQLEVDDMLSLSDSRVPSGRESLNRFIL